MYSNIITFLLLISLLLPFPFSSPLPPHTQPFSKIYAFGDSFTDTGNTNSKTGPYGFSSVSNLPYGSTFFHHPTNRYSDGRLVIDFLAATLSLPFLPPYLNRTSLASPHGVNFAVAGSTALDHEVFAKHNITFDVTPQSLRTQLEWFEEYLRKKGCVREGEMECKLVMKGALFWVGEIGVNDYAYSFGSSLSPQFIQQEAVQNVISFLEVILKKGANHIIVQGLPLTGCLPLTLFLTSPQDRDAVNCSSTVNNLSEDHNTLLNRKLTELRHRYPNAVISYADYLTAHRTIMANPKAFGFTEPFKACCGAGGGDYNFDIFNTCGSLEASRACPEPSRYVNWDGVHLTEAMYRNIANLFFHGRYCKPSFDVFLKKGEN